MTREQIIHNMCMTYRHDFNLVVENDEAMYSLSGITRNERQRIYNDMSQIFDNDIAPILEDYRKVNDGESVTVPKSKEHAEAMLRVAQWYLDTNK